MSSWSIVGMTVGVALASLGPSSSSRTVAEVLNLDACKADFDERFETLDVSPTGPGTRWIAHTPWFGDFGDAAFADPEPGFPFTTGPDGLTITARKEADGKWRSGLLSSTDPSGQGYAAQYGYFEMTATFPPGKGTWPAFWLVTADREANPFIEIDIVEYYGHQTDRYQMVTTVRYTDDRDARSLMTHARATPGSLVGRQHTYGAAVGRREVVYYLDRREVARTATPPEHTKPLGMLLNLALGSGWPIDETPNPSQMTVSRVAHYADLTGCGVPARAAGE